MYDFVIYYNFAHSFLALFEQGGGNRLVRMDNDDWHSVGRCGLCKHSQHHGGTVQVRKNILLSHM